MDCDDLGLSGRGRFPDMNCQLYVHHDCTTSGHRRPSLSLHCCIRIAVIELSGRAFCTHLPQGRFWKAGTSPLGSHRYRRGFRPSEPEPVLY
ncbi:hypothetical protein BD311DRAFT_727017 [Dichomitus squalens]|uniref:Uncharacterized protein n=1 Tax=Dichomitus squalens TaxID=114155 RepID=A0A4Q9MEZ7_9APHY|nr:hypothetical protein BD311DRAFT_727017 [Dichomitus squalens]